MTNLIKTLGVKPAFALFLTAIVFAGFLFTQPAEAQFGSSCSEYGLMAYESGGYCKCMTGYIMGENIFGEPSCISEDQACKDEYGYNARADFGGGCTCGYGNVFDTDTFGNKKCVDGNQVCRADHGYHSSYDGLSNKCKCDYNYTFDNNQKCVEKQNNVYFKLLDINPEDDKELLIKSDYDYSKYKVRVGIGCLSTTIERYRGKNLVVNLGTDYYVDTFDTLVLQDDSQTCLIVYREKTYDDSFPEPEEEETYYYTPVSSYVAPSYIATPEPVQTPASEPSNSTYDTPLESLTPGDETPENEAPAPDQGDAIGMPTTTTISAPNEQITQQSEPAVDVEVSFFRKIINFFKGWF